MESITCNAEQKPNAGSKGLPEHKQKDAQKIKNQQQSPEHKQKDTQKNKNQQQSAVTLKQQKKIQKQLVGENMERMNYLYQCASLVAKLSGKPKLQPTQLDVSPTSCAGKSATRHPFPSANKISEKLSSISTKIERLPGVAESCQSNILTMNISCHGTSSTQSSGGQTQPSDSSVSNPVQALEYQSPASSTSSPNTLTSEDSTVPTTSPSYSQSLSGVPSPLHPEIASNLGSTCRAIGRKCQLRMSHIMKRELCPSCYTPLVPSVTASTKIIRVRKKRVLVLTCFTCGGRRKRPCQDVKVLWTEKPESQLLLNC